MDTEKFIECVKKYPILYNPKHKDFKNYIRKLRTWDIVAAEMNESSDVVRTRWKGLKDGYTKYKKRNKSYSDWCWGSHMKFFDRYIKRRKQQQQESSFLHLELSSASIPSPTQSSTLLPEVSVKNEPYVIDTMASTSNSGQYVPMQQAEQSPRESDSRSRQASTASDDELDSTLNYIPNPKRVKRTDPIDYLFMSYAETFKKFSVRTQANIKIQLAKMFAEAEIQEYNISHMQRE